MKNYQEPVVEVEVFSVVDVITTSSVFDNETEGF